MDASPDHGLSCRVSMEGSRENSPMVEACCLQHNEPTGQSIKEKMTVEYYQRCVVQARRLEVSGRRTRSGESEAGGIQAVALPHALLQRPIQPVGRDPGRQACRSH